MSFHIANPRSVESGFGSCSRTSCRPALERKSPRGRYRATPKPRREHYQPNSCSSSLLSRSSSSIAGQTATKHWQSTTPPTQPRAGLCSMPCEHSGTGDDRRQTQHNAAVGAFAKRDPSQPRRQHRFQIQQQQGGRCFCVCVSVSIRAIGASTPPNPIASSGRNHSFLVTDGVRQPRSRIRRIKVKPMPLPR